MGQRLNIEIIMGGDTVANAYYHWSAYTSSALALTQKAIEAYESLSASGYRGLALAVKVLEGTGAGVNEGERERINNLRDPAVKNLKFKDCIDRNEGLLAITEEGIEGTRRWEEGRVEIDLDEKTVDFGVFSCYDSLEEFMRECEIDERELGELGEIPQVEFDFYDITFDNIYAFADLVDKHPNGVLTTNGEYITWDE